MGITIIRIIKTSCPNLPQCKAFYDICQRGELGLKLRLLKYYNNIKGVNYE